MQWIPLFLFLVLGLCLTLWKASYGSAYPDSARLIIMGASALLCLIATIEFARSFLLRPTLGNFLLVTSLTIWGISNLGFVYFAQERTLFIETLQTLLLWSTALLQMLGTMVMLRSRRLLLPKRIWLVAAFLLACAIIAFSVQSVLSGWLPSFYLPGGAKSPVHTISICSRPL